jgi:hypothetical protein
MPIGESPSTGPSKKIKTTPGTDPGAKPFDSLDCARDKFRGNDSVILHGASPLRQACFDRLSASRAGNVRFDLLSVRLRRINMRPR